MPRPDDPRLKALAELVHQLRPGWNRGGILSAVHACQRPGRTLPSIIRAAVDAALDPDVKTPAGMQHRDGDAWTPEARPTTTPADQRPCRRCRQIHHPDQAQCHRPTTNTADRAAEARAALRGGQ